MTKVLAAEENSNFLVPNATIFVELLLFLIIGLCEGMYFINLAFMALFVFVTGAQ